LVNGAIVILPLGAAIFIMVWIFAKVDAALNLSGIFWVDSLGHPKYIPGLGILGVLLIFLISGIIFSNFITEPIITWFNKWLKRLPIFNFFYTSIKDLTEAFVGDEKKFNEPILVDMPELGLKKIGFLTQKDLSKLNLLEDVAVYFPLSYSFAGQLCIVKAERVKPLDISATEAMKFVISGGVSHI
jgi:uncharacterized membrane protein